MSRFYSKAVTVCIVSFNQERFIRHCLDSVVSQEVNFSYEILVSDDASTDSTALIISEFVSKFPDLITFIKRDKNVGSTENLLAIYRSAKGEYIAHLDGDDAMLPGKLQAQVDFLNGHPECSFVTHNVQVIDGQGHIVQPYFSTLNLPQIVSRDELVSLGCFFVNSSKMFRASSILSKYRNSPTVDFYLHLEHSSRGKIGYINRILGQYRRAVGISSSAGRHRHEMLISYLDAYKLAVKLNVNEEIVRKAQISFRYINAMHAIRMGDIQGFNLMINFECEDKKFLSLKNKFFYKLRGYPKLLIIFVRLYDKLYRERVG